MSQLINPSSQVAVLAINFNSGDRIMRVIDALVEQDFSFTQVLVVDNASHDGSPEAVLKRYPEVDILPMGSNAGLSSARNAGLADITAPFVLMLDHDIYVQHGAVKVMLSAMLAQDASVVCPRIRLLPETDIVQADGAAVHFVGTMVLCHAYQPQVVTPVHSGAAQGCIGACMLVAREKVLAAGGFEPMMFFYFEDLEFSLRMRSLGHRIWCAADAEVLHERGVGMPGLSFRGVGAYPKRRAYFSMRHRLLTIFLHYRLRTLLVLAPALAVYELASLAAAIRIGSPGTWARAWFWQFRNWKPIIQRRRWIQQNRVRDDRELLTGGELPLAPGFLTSRAQRLLVKGLARGLDRYWRLVGRFVG
jgi:GT2 family glycosyltransferase